MLKNILINTIDHINELESKDRELMKDCINIKLERSLNNYESHLEETCKYILSRNPISIIKAVANDTKIKNQEN